MFKLYVYSCIIIIFIYTRVCMYFICPMLSVQSVPKASLEGAADQITLTRLCSQLCSKTGKC